MLKKINFVLMFILTNSIYAEIKMYPSSMKLLINKTDHTNELNDTLDSLQFIRVIDGINKNIDSQLVIVLYDSEKKIIEYHPIHKSDKPTPDLVFFMDKNTDRNFQGMKDIYHFPPQTEYIGIGIIDTKDDISGIENNIQLLTHPSFNNDHLLLHEKFLNIRSGTTITMLQIETIGDEDSTILRLAAFYFVP